MSLSDNLREKLETLQRLKKEHQKLYEQMIAVGYSVQYSNIDVSLSDTIKQLKLQIFDAENR